MVVHAKRYMDDVIVELPPMPRIDPRKRQICMWKAVELITVGE